MHREWPWSSRTNPNGRTGTKTIANQKDRRSRAHRTAELVWHAFNVLWLYRLLAMPLDMENILVRQQGQVLSCFRMGRRTLCYISCHILQLADFLSMMPVLFKYPKLR